MVTTPRKGTERSKPRTEVHRRLIGRRSTHVLVICLLLGALLLRLPGIAEPSIEQRETQSALRVRQWSLDRTELPPWKQRILDELPTVVAPIEPPLLDLVTAAHFRLSGENFWFPRLLSSISWVVGGLFLYLIAGRLTTREGALVALTLYLTWPFATWLSRHFMPDALMVASLLAAVLAVVRYWEGPSRRKLLVAGAVSAFATAVKPGVALFFLVGLFVALAVSNRKLRDTLAGGQLPLFVGMSALAAGIYFVWGTYLSDFIWTEADQGRITPEFVLDARFWTGWWNSVSHLLRFPQGQSFLALVPLAGGLAGLLLAPRGCARAILLGLLLGYLAFTVTVAEYASSNPYYSLPLIPILALGIGVLAGRALGARGRFATVRVASWVLAAAVISVAAYKSLAVVDLPTSPQAIADYRRIGELTNHTTRAIVVDRELSPPSMYWGWIVGRSWDLAYDSPPAWIRPEDADFLVVVGLDQLETSPGLAHYVRGLHAVARTSRFAIFNLGGRSPRGRSMPARVQASSAPESGSTRRVTDPENREFDDRDTPD